MMPENLDRTRALTDVVESSQPEPMEVTPAFQALEANVEGKALATDERAAAAEAAAVVAATARAAAETARGQSAAEAQIATQERALAETARQEAGAARDQAVAAAAGGSYRFPSLADLIAFVPADPSRQYYADVDGEPVRYAWNGAAPWIATEIPTLSALDLRTENFQSQRPGRTRDGRRYVDAWLDSLGRAAMGLLPSGAVEMSALSLQAPPRPNRDIARYALPLLRDALGRVALGVLPSGAIEVSDLSQPPKPRRARDSLRHLWSIRDRAGRTAIGIRPDGSTEVGDLRMGRSARRVRDAARLLWSLRDASGRAALGLLPSGAVEVGVLSLRPAERRARDARAFLGTLLRGRGGRTLLGWGSDGIDIALSPAGARHVAQALLAPPSALRGTHALAGPVMQTDRHTFGVVQEADGRVSHVQQLRQGGSTYAVAVSTARMRGLLAVGQSNDGAGSAEGPFPSAILKQAVFPYHVFENIAAELYGDDFTRASYHDSIRPAQDDLYGQSPRNAFLFALEQRARDLGLPSVPAIGVTNWRGSTPIEDFLPGAVTGDARPNGVLFSNIVYSIARMVEQAAWFGRGIDIDMLFIQGENPSPDYLAKLTALLDAVRAATLAANPSQRAPIFTLVQTNANDGSGGANGNELAQWAASRIRADTILAGPMYPYRFHFDDPGNTSDPGSIHVANLGRLEMGEINAIAYEARLRTGAWKPLQPQFSAATRAGATITVPCDVPAGAMQWDTDRLPMPSYGYRGIQASRVSDGSEITVSNVVLGAGVMTVTLASDPGGRVTLRGGLGQDGITDLWAGGRLPIYSEEPGLSMYYRLGLPTWVRPRHYMVRFSITTAQ